MRGIVSLFAVVMCLGALGCSAEGTSASSAELRASCDAVRCPMPLCVQGQHLSYSGGDCCPSCVGPQDRCAGIACPMYLCAMGYQMVTRGNQCCGTCEAVHHVAECNTDLDCPQYECFACPCPVSTCQGHSCVSTTPDASTCTTGI